MTAPGDKFLTARQFAELCGMGQRRGTKALARCHEGRTWHGHQLMVREVPGRGGRSGIRYEVALASLPPELQAQWTPVAPAPQPDRASALLSAVAASNATDWRPSIVRYITAAGAPGSSARAAALSAVSAVATYRQGKRAGREIGERTLRGWVADYERCGLLSTISTPRKDRGASRVIAWRKWDRAMAAAGVPEDRQHVIAKALSDKVRSFWASGTPRLRTHKAL